MTEKTYRLTEGDIEGIWVHGNCSPDSRFDMDQLEKALVLTPDPVATVIDGEVVETIRSILVTTVPEDMEEVDDLVIGTVQIRSMRKVAERIAAEATRQTKEMREALNKIAFTEVVQSDFKNWQRAKKIASQALANKGD